MSVPVRLVEFHVAHDCNLTCAGCSHFSPFAARQDVDPAELARDVSAAGARLHPEVVHVLGGEPLLNERLAEHLALFRRHFPEASIKVVTNGVLFLRVAGVLCDALRESDIGLAISVYPRVRLDRHTIERRCADAGVSLEFWPQATFLDFFDAEAVHDPAAARAHCPMENALNVRLGRVFPCPVTAWADLAGFRFEPTDGVPLDACDDEVRQVLSSRRTTSLCGHCRPQPERRPHRFEPRPSSGSRPAPSTAV